MTFTILASDDLAAHRELASPEEIQAALVRDVRRKASVLIAALHDLDGSRTGAGFNSASLGRARDCVEAAVAEVEG